MRKCLAFLYNVRHNYPDPNDPNTFLEADFDDPPTIEYFIKYLEKAGYNVLPIEAILGSKEILRKNRENIYLAFNYSEIVVGERKHVQVTSYLEELGIPHIGADDKDQIIIRNKARVKEILARNGIPTLPYQVFRTGNEELSEDLNFPLIVKPCCQGSSAGITNKSIVNNLRELEGMVRENIDRFKDDVVVEPFLTGREFSIPLLGNTPEIFPIVEPDFSDLPEGFKALDSYEVKWIYEEEARGSNHLMCPAKVDKKLEEKLKRIVLDVWKVLNAKDLCRIDLRCDREGNPYVLEVNSPPGLIPPEVSKTSYFPLSARVKGLSFEDLLKKIITSALERNKVLI